MHRKIKLSPEEIGEIKEIANQKRFELGFSHKPPIANAMGVILDRLKVLLLEIPIEPEGDKPAFSALIFCSKEEGEIFSFIGVNTADYYDKQVFAIAHELYHLFTRSAPHIGRLNSQEDDLIEAKANWFAAEFLLPEIELKQQLEIEFETHSLNTIPTKTLLRFIARLQCTWWLPYRSLVKRLWEIEAISEKQFQELYAINERDLNGEYGKIGLSIQSDVFQRLNTITNTRGASPKGLENILRNFEDNLIDEEAFAALLRLFNRTPNDFGYEISVSQEDIEEISEFIKGWDNES